ncbi:metallophosphoesterase family protein [Pseudoalteromonas sp. SS15]|uniref:metallophosphoesterase family protein n=1 Tax=Pseudoalteromonas sp. SS15 TaxID=3139393 RepID=UPI003BACE16C
MAWFEQVYTFDTHHLKLAHFTDCHLFANREGEYFSVNTASNLAATFEFLATQQLDAAIFGGDITQDHTSESYQLFAELLEQSDLTCPVFWLPGNHDEPCEYAAIENTQILPHKKLIADGVEVLLLNSKGDTPAGWCTQSHLEELNMLLHETENHVLALCHHHPVPINGYLDKHILENGPQLLNTLVESEKAKALIHGHVHNDYSQSYRELPVLATPATSIQFSKATPNWQQQNLGPAVRLIEFSRSAFKTEVVWLSA